jgi:hypothetical protein
VPFGARVGTLANPSMGGRVGDDVVGEPVGERVVGTSGHVECHKRDMRINMINRSIASLHNNFLHHALVRQALLGRDRVCRATPPSWRRRQAADQRAVATVVRLSGIALRLARFVQILRKHVVTAHMGTQECRCELKRNKLPAGSIGSDRMRRWAQTDHTWSHVRCCGLTWLTPAVVIIGQTRQTCAQARPRQTLTPPPTTTLTLRLLRHCESVAALCLRALLALVLLELHWRSLVDQVVVVRGGRSPDGLWARCWTRRGKHLQPCSIDASSS